MRKILFAAAVAVLAVAGAAAPAMHFHGRPAVMHYHGGPQLRLLAADPGTGHAAMIARNHAHRVCSTIDWSRQSNPNPGWMKVWWTCNGHNPKWQIRAVAHCQSGRNNIVYQGRWVWNVGSRSEASCTTAYPLLAGDGYDARQCGTCSWTRNWLHGTPVPGLRMHYHG